VWKSTKSGELYALGSGQIITRVTPSQHYTVDFVFKRLIRGNDVVVYLPVAGRMTTLQFGYASSGYHFDMLADQSRLTTVADTAVAHRVHVEVNVQDQVASLAVDLDDWKSYLTAKVPVEKLHVYSSNWEIQNLRRIAFGNADWVTQFSSGAYGAMSD